MNKENENEVNQPDTIILNIDETVMIRLDIICRLCANQSERIIGIYSEEGITHELATKMNMYLPLKISETDTLPLQCCWNCASTILAWHELVIGSVEADRKLKELQVLASKENEESVEAEQTKVQTSEYVPESTAASLSVFYDTTPTTVDDDRLVTEQNPKLVEKINLKVLKPEDLQDNFQEETFVSSPASTKTIPCEEKYDPLKTEEKELEVSLKKVCKTRTNKSVKQSSQEIPIKEDSTSSEWLQKEQNMEMYHFACQYCSFVFINEDDIVHHVKEKHPDEVDTIPPDPLLTLDPKKEKRKHSKIDQDAVNAAKLVVDGRVYYNCKICGKSLHSPYTYMWHMRIHTGERPYVCDLCGKQFRVSQGLVRHLRETHEGIKNFPCDLCGRMFSTRRNVEEHRRIHTNERPYICDLCGKSFKQKASLFVHNRSHTDYFPYRCSYCNQGFRTKPPLLIHVTRHTGEKPYPCDICGRCFRIKYELKRHRLVHSDEKPFNCAECGLSFRQKRYLRNHNKTNHNLVTP